MHDAWRGKSVESHWDLTRRLPWRTPGVPTGHFKFLGVKKGEPFKPFEAQWEILNSVRIPWPGIGEDEEPYPLIWGINCGRRFSKSTIGEILLWNGLIAPDDMFGPPTVKLTADTEEHAQKIWRRFLFHLENTDLNALLENNDREHNLVTLKSGATAQLLSANNPATLSGDGVTLWIIDEAQFITQAAFDNLMPSTAERQGIIVMFGVSEGEGPFREVCFKGDSDDYPEYKRLAYPTAANPFVPKWFIEFHRRTMSPSKFKQLYLAQWDSELGKLFRNIEGSTTSEEPSIHPKGFAQIRPFTAGNHYYGGLDLGRLEDWTVYSIWDRNGDLVAWDRYSIIDWELQKARAAEFSKEYGSPPTVVDSTGVGDPIFEDLMRLGMNVQEYHITGNEKKRILIDELAVRLGAGQLRFPKIPAFLEELQRFEAKKSSTPGSNIVRYEAPSGFHDDFVLSAALAMQVLPRPAPRVQSHTGDPYADRYPLIRRNSKGDIVAQEEKTFMASFEDDDPSRQRGAYEYLR